MLNCDETTEKVDDSSASNAPVTLQLLGGVEHMAESADLHHRSLLPVSMTRDSCWPGVPIVTLQK